MTYAKADPDGQARLAAFSKTLTEIGWIDGRNCQIEMRWSAGELERMHRLAKELIALVPDIVVVMSTPALTAVQLETKTIPVIFIRGPANVISLGERWPVHHYAAAGEFINRGRSSCRRLYAS
jgi:ABC-type uncharacterized transport system substrate-binding protein